MARNEHEVALRDHLAGLDPDQLAVVKAAVAGGNLQVVAGAGGGKSHTLVAIVGVLCHRGISPEDIVVTTFTKKAAEELLARIEKVVAPWIFPRLRISTTHSLALRKLRDEQPGKWPMQRCTDISGRLDSIPYTTTLWRWCLGRHRIRGTVLDGLGIEDEGIGSLARDYSSLANLMRTKLVVPPRGNTVLDKATIAEVTSRCTGRADAAQFQAAWRLSEEVKAQLGAWDFSDVLDAYYRGLLDGTLDDTAKFVLVDESQDQNMVQAELTRLLAQKGQLCLIGDGRQTIYGWNGAYPEAFCEAGTRIDAKRVDIQRNYRSGRQHVYLGNRIAEGQPWAMGAVSRPVRDLEGDIRLWVWADDPDEESDMIAHNLAADIAEGADPSDYAVLCRTNAQVARVEASLVRRRVPVCVVGSTAFFAKAEVRDFVAYMVLSRLDAYNALKRVRNLPSRYLGKAFDSSVAAMRRRMPKAGLPGVIRAVAPSLRGGSKAGALTLAATIERLRKLPWAAPGDTLDVGQAVIEILMPVHGKDGGDGDEDREGLLGVVAAVSRYFEGPAQLAAFAKDCLGHSRHVKDGAKVPKGRVTLTTIHRAKGRQFDTVILPISRGVLPHWRSVGTDQEAEELRLFYVACTRAQNHLWFTSATMGRRCGASGRVEAGLSPYFEDFVTAALADPSHVPLGKPFEWPPDVAGQPADCDDDIGVTIVASDNDCDVDADGLDSAPTRAPRASVPVASSVRQQVVSSTCADVDKLGDADCDGDDTDCDGYDDCDGDPTGITVPPMEPSIVIDTETTGIPGKPKGWKPQVIQLGAVVLDCDGNIVDSFECWVNPGAEHLAHPNSVATLKYLKLDPAPIHADGFDTEDASQLLREWIATSAVAYDVKTLRAYNQEFDFTKMLAHPPWNIGLAGVPRGACIMLEAQGLMIRDDMLRWMGPLGHKFPSAEEATDWLIKLGHKGLDGGLVTAHRALADADHEAKIAVALHVEGARRRAEDDAPDTGGDASWDGTSAIARGIMHGHGEVNAENLEALLQPIGFRQLRGGRAGQLAWASEEKIPHGVAGLYVYSGLPRTDGDKAKPQINVKAVWVEVVAGMAKRTKNLHPKIEPLNHTAEDWPKQLLAKVRDAAGYVDTSRGCPRCSGLMAVRNGRRGRFLACVRYPTCSGSTDL